VSELQAYLEELRVGGYADADAPRFEAAWDELEAAYLDRLRESCPADATWRERLSAAATTTIELVEAHPSFARFLVVDSLGLCELGRQRSRLFGERLAALVDTARADLDEPERPPPATAVWIVAIFFDRIYRRFTGDADPSLDAQLPELMFLAVSAYFGTAAGLEELPYRA
jgi:hypothetical protein